MEGFGKHCSGRQKARFLIILVASFSVVFIYTLAGNEKFKESLLDNLKRFQLNAVLKKESAFTSTSGDKTGSATKESAILAASLNSKKRGNFTAVILLTYMRSGSSLTGEILQQPNDTFYLFEPLKSIEHIKMKNWSISYLNGTVMANGSFDLQAVYLENLIGWLTCNFSRVCIESLLDTEFLQYSKKLIPYLRCIDGAGLSKPSSQRASFLQSANEVETEQFKKCLHEMRYVCLQSKYRIVKTIRTKMSSAVEVLQQVAASKVIHLIRDPRATIESKSHRNVCSSGLNFCITEHCRRVWEDTEFKERLESSRRFHTVKYEDIASRPIMSAKSMYDFIGMFLTPKITEYVYDITLGKNKSSCKVCKTRWQIGGSNLSSKSHVDAWKSKLPGKFITSTQRLCSDVLRYYGYQNYAVPYTKRH